jgi:hypothetical protein
VDTFSKSTKASATRTARRLVGPRSGSLKSCIFSRIHGSLAKVSSPASPIRTGSRRCLYLSSNSACSTSLRIHEELNESGLSRAIMESDFLRALAISRSQSAPRATCWSSHTRMPLSESTRATCRARFCSLRVYDRKTWLVSSLCLMCLDDPQRCRRRRRWAICSLRCARVLASISTASRSSFKAEIQTMDSPHTRSLRPS